MHFDQIMVFYYLQNPGFTHEWNTAELRYVEVVGTQKNTST